jgi:uncharacterized protein YjbI with pentapeptide repeats/alpha-tubulin suppressor-like RCC1 family protein
MRSSHLRFQVNTALGELTPPRHGPFAITCRWRGQARGGRIVMAGQVFLRLLPRLLPFFLAHGAVAAQSIGLQLADSARLVTNPSSRVAVPILVDFASAAGANLAALQAGLAWNPARLTLDSIRGVAGTGFSLATNLAAAATGISTFNLFNTTGLTTSGALLTAHFTAAAGTGGTRVVLTPTTAGNEAGNSILPLLRVRNLDVCVALSGRWGDANGDDLVNIIDAQQVARYSVGLSVANAAVLVARADVTADGSINIIDAQQIARFSVGLSAAARTGTSLGTVPVATALALTPGSAQTVAPGAALTLTATPRDGSGNDLTGCATVSWSTSNPTVATVSSEGTVLGVAAGTATITATSGSLVQTVAVTVQAQFTLAVGTQPAGGTSNVVLPTQPALQLRHADNTPVTTESRLVTVSIASGSGTLSGTTAVTTVNGVATFGDLAITGVGAHTLRFSATGALDVTSAPFTVSAPTTMRLLVGNSPTQVGTAGTDVVVPLLLDLAGRGTQDLASVQATITWDPTKLTYLGNGPGTWVDQNGDPATVTANVNNVSTGSFTIGGFTNAPTTLSSTLRSLTFRPVASGPLVVNAQVTASGNAAGTAVVVAPRSLGLTSVAAAVASVRLAPTTATLAIGQSQDLVATPLDANGAALAGRSVTFSSSQPSIATVTATGRVTAVAVGTATMTATSEGRTATAAITVSDLVPGLSAAYFVVPPTITTMPAFRGMVPYRTGSVPQLNYQVAGADTNFAGSARADFVGAVFEGFLTVPSAGNWTLHLESDDGGMLYLNDALVVNNDGIHPAVERSGTVTLAAGRHPIRIEMFEADGGAVMVLRAEGPGFAKAVVPTSMLSRRIEPTLTVGTPELILGVGQTGTQTATVFNPDGTVRTGAAVTWGSTAPTVATVTGTGAVTAVGIGTAYVTAAVDGKVVGGYVQVRGAPAQAIGAGFAHACLRDGTGRVSCWGNDAAGQLGDGAAGAGRVTPATITSPVLFSRVATRWDRNCALTAAGTASCWGQGAGATPTAVGGSLSLTSIVVGFGFSCGLTSAGAAHCWGDNGFGQLGDGTTTARATPTAVVGGRNFVQLAAGADHACGVTADGQLLCWGRNVYGAIGDGTTVDRASPTVVAPGRRFATISAGEYFSCAFDQGRTLFCWGDNRFQHLVAGSTSNVLTPVSIPGGNLLESVVGAEHHLCGLTGGGQMHCRGTNADGELGNGSTTSLANLGLVATPAPFTELALGRAHSCGRTATGAVYCWGSNGSGQLGDGTTTRRTVPTLVQVPTNTVSLTLSQGRRTALIGQSFTLGATPRDANGNILTGRSITWSSSVTSVATVNATGMVTTTGAGTAAITATVDGISATATVVVSATGVQYSSRRWDGVVPSATGVAMRTVLDSLLQRPPTTGYCDTVVAVWDGVGNATCTAGVNSSIAFRTSARFNVPADQAGTWFFRLGLDAGHGSAWYLDGVPMAVNPNDAYSNTAFTGRASLTAGAHLIEVVGFENCCSGPATSSMSRDSLAWIVIPGGGFSGAMLDGRDLSRRDFSGLAFVQASMRRANLTGTRFVGSDLTGARLDSALLQDADLSGATVAGATWTEAIFNSATKWPAGFSPAGKGMWGPGMNYSGMNLSQRVFYARDFEGSVFVGTNMSRSDFQHARLVNATLTNARLDSAWLRDADLTGATVAGATWTEASFNSATKWPAGFSPAGKGMWGPGMNYSGMNLSQRDFIARDFEGSVFVGTNMSRSMFQYARLVNATLTNARLDSARLRDADLTGATVAGATWTEARFNSATKWPAGFSPAGKGMWGPGMDYSGMNLRLREFFDQDFSFAVFVGTSMQNTNFQYANLVSANLTNARLDSALLLDADLTSATLVGVTLVGARYNAGTKWPAGFNPAGRGMIPSAIPSSGQDADTRRMPGTPWLRSKSTSGPPDKGPYRSR